jgi:hypothetical protein
MARTTPIATSNPDHNVADRLESAINRLQLPISPPFSSNVREAVASSLGSGDAKDDDLALAIDRLNDEWIATERCPTGLSTLIVAVLSAALTGRLADVLPRNYVAIIVDLQRTRGGNQGWEGLSLQQARRLMSRVSLIEELLDKERMSATQVSRFLAKCETSIDVHFRAIRALAGKLGLQIGQSNDRKRTIHSEDRDRSLAMFPDGDLSDACERAIELVTPFAPHAFWGEDLRVLFRLNDADGPENNYLQVLNLALIPLEDRDHPPAYMYEFSPRGDIARELLSGYPVETQNAALNLSKSVYCLDDSWARSKSSTTAAALVRVLNVLENLPFLSRREIARVLRAVLHRYLSLQIPSTLRLPAATASSVDTAMRTLALQPTGTQGVLEQRVMDACLWAYWTHVCPAARGRGLGDPVNASNFARRKLGDIEFQDTSSRKTAVYEIHGGTLTPPYVASHDQSLRRGLPRRLKEEWINIADASDWSVNVTYICHAHSGVHLQANELIEGVSVNTDYTTFEAVVAMIAKTVPSALLVQAFQDFVHTPLNAQTGSDQHRRAYAEMAGLLLAEPS